MIAEIDYCPFGITLFKVYDSNKNGYTITKAHINPES